MDDPDSCCCTNVKRPPFARPEGSWNRMPVICARYVSPQLKRAAKQAYHHDERAPVEEAAVYVRNEADRERAHCSRDVALVAEARAGEVVRHPADT